MSQMTMTPGAPAPVAPALPATPAAAPAAPAAPSGIAPAQSVVVPEPGAAPAAPVDPAAAAAAAVPPIDGELILPGDPRSVQTRINKITSQKYAAIARAESAERRLAALQGQIAAGPPNPAAYNDPSRLMVDTINHGINAGQVETLRVEASNAREEAAQIQANDFAATLAEKRATIPDVDIITKPYEQGGPRITPQMGHIIQTTENGLELGYYLAKNVPLSERIAALPPDQQLYHLGQIAQRLVPNPPRVSSAPPPVPTVGQRPPAAAAPDLATMPIDQFMKQRNEQERKGSDSWGGL